MIFTSTNHWRKLIFRSSLAIIAIVIVGACASFMVGLLSKSRSLVYGDIKYYQNVVADQKVLALTFDDGPDPIETPAIIDILKRQNVPATFFFLGSHALNHPEVVKQSFDAGFEIGNHTFTHAHGVHDSQTRLDLELNVTDKILRSITGESSALYRPPFLLDIGSDPTSEPNTPEKPLAWAAQLGYVVVGADIDSKDWSASSPEMIVEELRNELKVGGHLVLFHDGGAGKYTVQVLEQMIIDLKAEGYTFVRASDVLGMHARTDMLVTRNLFVGDTDENTEREVSKLQTFLRREGDFLDTLDGVFGESTQASLKVWQQRHKVPNELGLVGPITRAAIAHSLDLHQLIPPKFSSLHPFQDLEQRFERFFVYSSSTLGAVVGVIVFTVLILAAVRLALVLVLRAINHVRRKHRLPAWYGGVSVIIPVHNEAENVAATIDSVLKSSYTLLEVIVVDDGSTDSSAEVVRAIQSLYPTKVKLISVKNGGKASALNIGIAQAEYDIVVTMDGDTIFDRSTISTLVRHFNDIRVGAVAGKLYPTRSRSFLNHFQRLEYLIGQNMEKAALSSINAVGVVPGPISAWRKSVLLELGGYSTDTLVEDQDLTLAMLAAGKRVEYEAKAVAYSEAPHSIRDLKKQRFRWNFGTIQCLWKYRRYMFNLRHRSLGWVVLPNTLIFNLILTLLMPMMDLLLVMSIFLGSWRTALPVYGLFIGIDLVYAAIALWRERDLRSLPLLPLQRLSFRILVYYVVMRSLMKAIEGTEATWNKVQKRGHASEHHEAFNRVQAS